MIARSPFAYPTCLLLEMPYSCNTVYQCCWINSVRRRASGEGAAAGQRAAATMPGAAARAPAPQQAQARREAGARRGPSPRARGAGGVVWGVDNNKGHAISGAGCGLWWLDAVHQMTQHSTGAASETRPSDVQLYDRCKHISHHRPTYSRSPPPAQENVALKPWGGGM